MNPPWWMWLLVGFATGWAWAAVTFALMVNKKVARKRPGSKQEPGRETHQAVTPVVHDRPGG